MWVVVLVVLNALTGPDVTVNRDAVYATEDACKAAIARNVPARLDATHKTAFEQGYRRYVCVRVGGTDDLLKAK